MTLDGFFRENGKAALAFSGGVDSAFLLHYAIRLGADVRPYYVKTAFQPRFELDDAMRLASQLDVGMKVLEADVFACPAIVSNPPDRCYHCKRLIMETIASAAAADGYGLVIDGTNASDDLSDRPGARALAELGVRSPLRECGLGKDEIRILSRKSGLFTWDKPAYACLATRIPCGEMISSDKLIATEQTEDFLRDLGFSGFRIRMMDGCARLQVHEEQIQMVIDKRQAISDWLRKYYKAVLLDLEVRNG